MKHTIATLIVFGALALAPIGCAVYSLAFPSCYTICTPVVVGTDLYCEDCHR